MAEVYTVTINNETPTEITGGRVGSLKVMGNPNVRYGGSNLAVSYAPAPSWAGTVSNGVYFSMNQGDQWIDLYVTSPDDIYALAPDPYLGDPEIHDDVFHYHEWELTIFHNR